MTQSATGDLKALPVADRLKLIEDLWDSIEAETSDPLPLPDWHRSEIDRRLECAARSMGASTASVIWHVILPLIMPGIAAAALLVFIVSAGFFITPVILGAPSDMMISNLIDYYVHELINFNNAAALAVLVALLLAPVIILQQRVVKRGQYGVG